jgi:hypothetical protein
MPIMLSFWSSIGLFFGFSGSFGGSAVATGAEAAGGGGGSGAFGGG